MGVTAREQKGHSYDCSRETEREVLDLGMGKEGLQLMGTFWDMGQEFRFYSKRNIKLLKRFSERCGVLCIYIF